MAKRGPRSRSERRALRGGSVQRRFVAARAVQGAVLCLTSGKQRSITAYVAVLQVAGKHLTWSSPQEQWQRLEQLRALLHTLSAPVQVLWRIVPRPLSSLLSPLSPLLDHPLAPGEVRSLLSANAHEKGTQIGQATPPAGIWYQLARHEQHLLEQESHEHPLLEHSCYLLVRVSAQECEASTPGRAGHLVGDTRRKHSEAARLAQAQQLLDVRCQELMRQLAAMQVAAHRLTGPQQLVPLYFSCLTAVRAAHSPLSPAIIDSLDRPMKPRFFAPFRRSAPGQGRQGVSLPAHGTVTTESSELSPPVCGFARLADLLAPAAVVVSPDHLKVEDEYVRLLVVHHLPREVAPGWLAELSQSREPLEVSFHLVPLQETLILAQLRRQLASYRSLQLMAQRKGSLADPTSEAAANDIEDVLSRLSSGEDRMLALTWLVLVRGTSRRDLERRTRYIMARLEHLGVLARTALFEQEAALRACLPEVRCSLDTRLLLDSRAASCFFPFLPAGLFHRGGLLEGITPDGEPVQLDPWHKHLPNANRLLLGRPGSGKSYQVKGEIVRSLLSDVAANESGRREGTQYLIIDPEGEFGRQARALGGQVITLSAGSAHHLNPFDLPAPSLSEQQEVDATNLLADHVHRLHDFFDLLLADRSPTGRSGRLSSQEKALLDRALLATYAASGITGDRQTHHRPAPLLSDLFAVLSSGQCGLDPTDLGGRLQRYVHGSLGGLFAGPTTIKLEQRLIVFDVRALGQELRPIGLFLVAHLVWTAAFGAKRPRRLIVDEAASLYEHESGAHFLEELVRRARKHYLGVTVIVQHPSLLAKSALPANCATHLLFGQEAAAIEQVAEMEHLSPQEVALLRQLAIGEALLLVGGQHLHLRVLANRLTHLLATTHPRELMQEETRPARQHGWAGLGHSWLDHTSGRRSDPLQHIHSLDNSSDVRLHANGLRPVVGSQDHENREE